MIPHASDGNAGTGRLPVTRRALLQALATTGIGSLAFQRALAVDVQQQGKITPAMVQQAEWIAGLELEDAERDDIASTITSILESANRIRQQSIDFETPPAQVFLPDFFYKLAEHARPPGSDRPNRVHLEWSVNSLQPALSDEELAFASVEQQASLLSRGKISSRELTELYLKRLSEYDPMLKCVVTRLDEVALDMARASDERRAMQQSRGILDGIPWVAKDLIAIPPWKTTWGAEPFRDQVRPELATVAQRLEAAGAVVLAKVTLGALAWGDVWFGGKTRNPWNTQQGSSGSSAGTAACAAAGLASFGIGSETLGSIVSPCRRCRTSGLRPTFGRISRAGCMPLAWSMDKLGPIARYASDLAFVFANLLGADGKDPSVVERPFRYPIQKKASQLTIGLTDGPLNAAEQQALEWLQQAGARIVACDLKSQIPVDALSMILGVEASTVFEESFLADRDADYGLWPRTFRNSQFVSAVHYLQANRLRGSLITETESKLRKVDAVLGGDDLTLTNLTGHPTLVVTCGTESLSGVDMPGIVKLTSAAYCEELLLRIGVLLQRALPPSPRQPNIELAASEDRVN